MKNKGVLNARRRTKPYLIDFSYVHCRSHLKTLRNLKHILQNHGIDPIVLDIGCGHKPFETFFGNVQYLGIDVDPQSKADYILDCNNDTFPLPDESVDVVLLSNSLEHIFNTLHLLSEIKRVLKPGGLIFVSVPMTFPVHAHPDDYCRYTPYFFKRMFSGWRILALNCTNSVFSTPLLLTALLFETMFPVWITWLPCMILNSITIVLDSLTKSIFSFTKVGILMDFWSSCPMEINGIFQKP